MDDYVTEALKGDLEDLSGTVLEVLTNSRWNVEMLSNPENETRLVAVLKEPWLYYDEKGKMPRKLGHLNVDAIGDVHDAAVAIAATLVGSGNVRKLQEKEMDGKMGLPLDHHFPSIYGIDLRHPEFVLPRPNLLQKVYDNFIYPHSLIYAPPATGKTSLVQILRVKMSDTHFIYISCVTLSSSNCFETLSKNGIDLLNQSTSITSSTIIVLDDCHAWFGRTEFWIALLRDSVPWLPPFIKFLLVATELLFNHNRSPVSFTQIPRLGRKDFLLSIDESVDLIERIGLKSGSTFPLVLIQECAGIVGLITLSLMFMQMDFRFSPNPSESDVLRHFYSQGFLRYSSRCFNVPTNSAILLNSPAIEAVRFIFSSARPVFVDVSLRENEGFSHLEKAGIIVCENGFYAISSPYAKRFMLNLVFPNRSQSMPENVNDLVLRVISRMSSNLLKNSIVSNTDDFPKEAIFQHLFISGLAAECPPNASICPELGRRFPKTLEENSIHIDGEIDFYIDGDIRWGIEILVGGDKLGEHLARCRPNGGKYAKLEMLDYAVLDFRRGGDRTISGIRRDSKRITVIFPPNDFATCKVIIGLSSKVMDVSLQS